MPSKPQEMKIDFGDVYIGEAFTWAGHYYIKVSTTSAKLNRGDHTEIPFTLNTQVIVKRTSSEGGDNDGK